MRLFWTRNRPHAATPPGRFRDTPRSSRRTIRSTRARRRPGGRSAGAPERESGARLHSRRAPLRHTDGPRVFTQRAHQWRGSVTRRDGCRAEFRPTSRVNGCLGCSASSTTTSGPTPRAAAARTSHRATAAAKSSCSLATAVVHPDEQPHAQLARTPALACYPLHTPARARCSSHTPAPNFPRTAPTQEHAHPCAHNREHARAPPPQHPPARTHTRPRMQRSTPANRRATVTCPSPPQTQDASSAPPTAHIGDVMCQPQGPRSLLIWLGGP